MDAINYAQSVLSDNSAIARLLPTAETLKKLEKKVKDGGNLTKEEIVLAKPVTG